MKKLSGMSNNDSFIRTGTIRWDRISLFILDGVSRDIDHNARYFSSIITALVDHNMANACVLTGI
jgi:hypothetical protein